MTLRSLIHFLWLGSFLFQAVLGVVLFVRRFWQKYPFFTLYLYFNLISTILCYVVRNKGIPYFYAFWSTQAISIILGFAVVFEIFDHFLAVHAGLRRLALLCFRCAVAILICVGVFVTLMQSSAIPSRIASSVLTVEEATRTIEVGLILFLFIFATAFGLHWRQHVFGIALGLGIYASVELIAVTMHLYSGVSSVPILSAIEMISFVSSLLIWLGYILAPERVTVGELPKREQLEQWNQAVLELIGQ